MVSLGVAQLLSVLTLLFELLAGVDLKEEDFMGASRSKSSMLAFFSMDCSRESRVTFRLFQVSPAADGKGLA